MKKICLLILVSILFFTDCIGQDAPNVANAAQVSTNAQQSNKLNNVPVNLFSGMPAVSIPIYSYGKNGLEWGVSLSYFAGGNQMLAGTPDLGLGWSLNATAEITRTVRGLPDDLPNGYIYSSTFPADVRGDANKYYYDSLDAQQDVFQFNVPGASGNFFIGRDKQIVVVPTSKIKISYTAYNGTSGIITGFKIITENGNRYDFYSTEATTLTSLTNTQSGYVNQSYCTAWYLSKAISQFNTDTIVFNYSVSAKNDTFNYPQTKIVRSSDGVTTQSYAPTGTMQVQTVRINNVVLPDKKTVSFIYDKIYANATDSPLVQINISDTTLRLGYKLRYKYREPVTIYGQDTTWRNIRSLLTTITPFIPTGTQKGYSFSYISPILEALFETTAEKANQRDHWGYYNGATGNGTNTFPIVNGVPGGASRNPSLFFAKSALLSSFYLPDGGYTLYEYELNDHYPYVKDPVTISIATNTSSQNTITLNQVFSTKHQLTFSYANTVLRNGSVPIGGSGNLQLYLKSTDGSTTYASANISLYELFYEGIKTWTFNAANGNYRLDAQLSSGTSLSTSLPINITWENKLPDNTTNSNTAGGLRVKKISRTTGSDNPVSSTEEYKYVTEDGKSSGFFGDYPKYDYPYYTTVINGGTTITPYTAVNSEPVSNVNYTQGSPVGYSRVEIIKGTTTNNIGKIVYEFTDLRDVNAASLSHVFPYAPVDWRSWGIGLPKKTLVYDKNTVLVQKTVQEYAYDSVVYQTANYKSLRFGKAGKVIYGNPNSPTSQSTTYVAQEFYPSSGRIYLTSTKDSLFQYNGSVNTTYTNYTYDANYNLKTITGSYDKNRNLQLQKRFYYPYDYTIGGAVGTLRNNDILSPVIATESWITGDANPRMLTADITDFQILTSGHLRPFTVYATETNAPIPQSVIGSFNPASLIRNTTCIKPEQSFTLFDDKGNLLQTESPVSGRKAATLLDNSKLYPIASVVNAGYNDVAYTSFEDNGNGGWFIGGGNIRNKTNALTGEQSYDLLDGYISKSGINTAIPYTLTLWAKSPSGVYVNNVLQNNPIATQNGWDLFKVEFSSTSVVHINGYGLIDELRLHPKNANMVTTTYKPGLGLATSSTDANNTVVYTMYDSLNRVKLIRDKDKNIITKYEYGDPPVTQNTVNNTPNWQPCCIQCSPFNNGAYDSLYSDINPYSATYNTTQIVSSGYNYCACSSNPQYKIVNGLCEYGTKVVTASVYMKVCDGNGNCTWKWRCTYHYVWSNNSYSQDYVEYSNYSCSTEQ